MLLTARKSGANCRSSLLPTCTESPILCHTSNSNNRSVVAISFRRRYHNNRPDISPSVNFTLAQSANSGRLSAPPFPTLIPSVNFTLAQSVNSGRLFCTAFSNTDTVEPILPILTPPWRAADPLLHLSGSPAYLAGRQSPAFFGCGIMSGSPQCWVSASVKGQE